MDKHLYWAWAIKNSICVICWVALAIIFNKWWIALFGALFISDIKQNHKYCRTCDKCGKHSPYANTYIKALDEAKYAGWIHYAEINKDYCPKCKTKIEETNNVIH